MCLSYIHVYSAVPERFRPYSRRLGRDALQITPDGQNGNTNTFGFASLHSPDSSETSPDRATESWRLERIDAGWGLTSSTLL